MNDQNVYQTPESEIVNKINDFDVTKILAVSQRIGRIRWLGYNSLTFMILLSVQMLVLFTIGDMSNRGVPTTSVLDIIIATVYIAAAIILTVRRLHDLNFSGWFTLFMIIPYLNIVFSLFLLFAPGTKGENEYGKEPMPNTIGIWFLAFIPFILGVLAAIAIPAYQDYVMRSQADQIMPQQ